MGQNKALIPFQGRPLIWRVLERVQPLADEILITANQPAGLEDLGPRLVPDAMPGKGALGGLYTALLHAAHPLVAVVACDMPFLHAGLLAAQIDLLREEGADVVIPSTQNGMEPLHAVYRRETCLPAVRAALENDQHRLISWFPDVKVRVMLEDEARQYDARLRSFININTPDDLQRAEELASAEG